MPGPLTYVSITLMARDRLGQIRDALRAKVQNAPPGRARDMERQVLYLADQAHRMLSVDQPSVPAPLRLYGPPFGDQVSKFALMGAMGPDLPRYAALFAPGQGWLADTIHKGTPDAHKEKVLVGSTQLPLRFWTAVKPHLSSEYSDADELAAKTAAMRAYTLGHLCHVAADVVAAPFLEDVEGHLGIPGRDKLDRRQVVGAIETRVSQDFFRRGTDTRGTDWADWWPKYREIPGSFFKAYKEALEAQYGSGAVQAGFGAYEAKRESDDPSGLSEDLLKDGYQSFYEAVQIGTSWDLLDWMSVTWPMFVPAFAALPLAALMPAGKDYFRDTKPEGYDEAQGVYEVVVFPFAATSVVPLMVTFWVTLTHVGAADAVIFGWVSAGVQIAAAVAFFASLGGAGAERWIPIFAIPLLVEILHIVFTSIWGGGEVRHQQLALGSALHIVLSFVFVFFHWAFLHFAVEALDDDDGDMGAFAGILIAWFFILAALWIGVCLLMRYVFSARLPSDVANTFVTGRNHQVRLFDDTTLFHAPTATEPTLADLHYPSGRRELLKLWWPGAGEPTVQSFRDRLVFEFSDGTTRTAAAPLAPMTATEYGDFLKAVVTDGGGVAGLEFERVYAEDLDYALPAGPTFADHGDDQTTVVDHDAKAADKKPLGTSKDDAYVLHHVPKVQLSVAHDRLGPSIDTEDRSVRVPGRGTLTTVAGTPTQITVSGANHTRLTQFFRPGDQVEAPTGGPRRTIVSVDSDTQITVSTPFPVALPGTAFARSQLDRTVNSAVLPGRLFSDPTRRNELFGDPGSPPTFGVDFKPGDVIRVNHPPGTVQERVIVRIVSDTRIVVAGTLNPPICNVTLPVNLGLPCSGQPALGAGARFSRKGERERQLFGFLADPADTLQSGEAVMNHAADLAALLCLGGTTHLLDDAAKDAARVGTASGLNEAYQVFRNWNLDRRRVNEWKMLVQGGALSEKRGDPTAADPAAPVDPGWTLFAPQGEAVSNRLGWVNVLRRWVDMASRPETDTSAETVFKPGDPTNLELSRALAYLLDMRDPVSP